MEKTVKRTYRLPKHVDTLVKDKAKKAGLSENQIAIIQLSKIRL